MSPHWISLLEELRAMAQKGLYYTEDPYDRERYTRILALAAQEYAERAQLSQDVVLKRFQAELGHITPKVGVDAAIVNSEGQILLIQRADDLCWGLPAGWLEVMETPEEAIVREVWEETRLSVEVKDLIKVHTRLPGDFEQPHSTIHILYGCQIVSGAPTPTEEALQVGFYDPNTVSPWHQDHAIFARNALAYYAPKSG